MPVTKFRSLDEARKSQRSVPGSEENIRRMRAILELWSRLRPRHVRRGVFKYHSPSEAQESERGQK